MNTNFVINTSKIRGYKNKLLGISLIAMFAISILMAFSPNASAQIGLTQPRPSLGYISVAPRLIGVGQTATVNLWVAPSPTGYSLSPWYGPPPGFLGFSVTFTRPDGTKDTFMPQQTTGNYVPGQSDALGAMVFYYVPNIAGNWSVTMSMPAQNFTDASGTVLYAACSSSPAYFTVTTEQQNAGLLNGWPWAPLPNDNVYWNYPINSNNREWASIAGPMYPQTGGGTWQPYGLAPSSPHIVWQLQGGNGGLMGGDTGTLSLQGAGSTPIILMGKAYISGINALGGANCYDLTTGKLLWESNNTVTRAIFLPGNEFSQSTSSTQATGVVLADTTAPAVYLFGTSTGATIKGLATQNWNYIDPLTGRIAATFTNATMGTGIMRNYNELVFGNVMSGQRNVTPYYMNVNYVWGWNRSKVVGNDWYTGLMWTQNVSRHWGGVDEQGPGDGSARTAVALSDDMSTLVVGGGPGDTQLKGFSTTDGHSVWNTSFNYVSLNGGAMFNTNYFLTFDRPQGTWRCYSDLTGALLWAASDLGINEWATQTSLRTASDASNAYFPSPDGTVTALNKDDGTKLWTSKPILTGEEVTNSLGCWQLPIVAGGFVYVYCGYSLSYELEPIPRFSVTACLNATTGETVWILNGGNNPVGEANGYLFTTGIFSGMITCIGKGQTSSSVAIQNDVVAKGATVLIKGNVLDQSPASPGTPAVSEASMSEWMDYLQFQNATLLNSPPSPLGVQVTLTAVDPNMNCITIGTTTTDAAGNYGFNYVPPITGMYTITATFAGSNSYWPSSSETMLTVTEAPAATSTATTTTSADVTTPIYIVGIALAIVIIIVGAVIVLLQRKRP
jgi:hypothetical protein